MLESGIKLDPYEAMLHARKMSKKMSVKNDDLQELVKKSPLRRKNAPADPLSLSHAKSER